MRQEVREMISRLSAEEASEVITEIGLVFGMEFTTSERCEHAQRGAIHLMREHQEISTPTSTSQSIWGVARQTCSDYRKQKALSRTHDKK